MCTTCTPTISMNLIHGVLPCKYLTFCYQRFTTGIESNDIAKMEIFVWKQMKIKCFNAKYFIARVSMCVCNVCYKYLQTESLLCTCCYFCSNEFAFYKSHIWISKPTVNGFLYCRNVSKRHLPLVGEC